MQRRSLALIAAWFLCQTSLSQTLREVDPITQPGTKVRSHVVLPRSGSLPPLLAVFYETGNLSIYGANRTVVYQERNVKRFAAVDTGHLYYEPEGGFTRLDLLRLSTTQLKLPHEGYTDYELFEEHGQEMLLALSTTGIDVITLPQCVLLAQIQPGSDWRRHILLYDSKVVVFLRRDNELAGYDLNEQRVTWTVDTGTRSMKLLGISFRSVKNFVTAAVTSGDGHFVYAGTALGDLYRIDTKTGKLLANVKQFRGDANNAGCLVQMYLKQMDRGALKDIVTCSVDNNIYCLNAADFSIRWLYDTGNEVQMPMCFFDVTRDGIPDVFAVNDYDVKLMVLDGASGKLLAERSLKTEDSGTQCSITVVDLEGDGDPYVLTRTTSGRLRTFRYH